MPRKGISLLLALAAGILIGVAGCAPIAGPPAALPASPTPPAAVRQALLAATPDAAALDEAASSAPLAMLPTPNATAQEEAVVVGGSHGAPPPAVVSLEDEIFLAGAPSFAYMFLCEPLAADAALPALTWQQEGSVGQLCLYGFPDGAEVAYEVFDAEGTAVTGGTSAALALDGPQPAAAVMLDVEFFAAGQWAATAQAGGVTLRGAFDVAAVTPARVVLRLTPGPAAAAAGRGLGALAAGDDLFVAAVHLPPDAEIAVGVYFAPEQIYAGSDFTLHEQAVFPSDAGGTLSARLALDPSYKPGFYCVVVTAASDYAPEHGPGALGATECFTLIGG